MLERIPRIPSVTFSYDFIPYLFRCPNWNCPKKRRVLVCGCEEPYNCTPEEIEKIKKNLRHCNDHDDVRQGEGEEGVGG